MPEKPRRSISRAISRVRLRRPGTATRLIAGNGKGIGGSGFDGWLCFSVTPVRCVPNFPCYRRNHIKNSRLAAQTESSDRKESIQINGLRNRDRIFPARSSSGKAGEAAEEF